MFESEVKGIQDAMVGRVSQIHDLLQESRAANTVNNYRGGFLRWKKWLVGNGFEVRDALPAKAFRFALHLVSHIQQSKSSSPLINAFYSIKWIHSLYDKRSPTDSNVEPGNRRLTKRVNKKESISIERLTKMYNALYRK